jgi:hypothetical protein
VNDSYDHWCDDDCVLYMCSKVRFLEFKSKSMGSNSNQNDKMKRSHVSDIFDTHDRSTIFDIYAEDKGNASSNKTDIFNISNTIDIYSTNKTAIQIQLIAMSATVSNIQLLANWFGAKLFITNFRPVPLIESLAFDLNVYDKNGQSIRKLYEAISHKNVPVSKNEKSPLSSLTLTQLNLCYEGLLKHQQILIFCPTRATTETTCQQILLYLIPLLRSGSLCYYSDRRWRLINVIYGRNLVTS